MCAFLASLFGFVELLADVLLDIREAAAFKTNMNRCKRGQADPVQVDLILPSMTVGDNVRRNE